MELDVIFEKYWKPEEFKKLVRFGITGLANTLVDCLVFFLLNSVFGVNLSLSQVCGYSAGTLNSYLINRSWTFQSKQRFFSAQMIKFIAGNLLVLAVSVGLLNFFVYLTLPMPPAKLAVICVTMALNFLISRLWVFR